MPALPQKESHSRACHGTPWARQEKDVQPRPSAILEPNQNAVEQETQEESMSDPLKPAMTTLIKLGSIAVHAEEMADYGFNPQEHAFLYDKGALLSLLQDTEVREWIAAMNKLAFVPIKRK